MPCLISVCIDERLTDVYLIGDISVRYTGKYCAMSQQCMDGKLADVCLIDDTACQ